MASRKSHERQPLQLNVSASDADGERLGVNYWVRCQLSLILNTALNNRKLEPGSVIKGAGRGR